jgi:hypothetical protein
MWNGHFVLGVMLTSILMHWSHLFKINAWDFFITPGLPPLCVAIENKFGRHTIGDQILNFV